MNHSDLIRNYFSAYENKDRQTVEALLTHDFVFTSLYDNRIDREAYFKRCYTQSQLDKIALRLNQRPRKTLGFETPASKLRASVAPTS